MTTLLYTHPDCLKHDTGPHHPESPERLRSVLARLATEPFAFLDRREAPKLALDVIEHVHPRFYIESILEAEPTKGYVHLDPDTVVSPGSGQAALRAAGAVSAAVDAVFKGEGRNAFCAVRPPGHHAEPTRAMGFCLFNNVAIAAKHARAVHPIKRIAVVDFDVHHGNGTQYAFENDPELFYASSHQSPCYPGTGKDYEHGTDGDLVNVELDPGAGSAEFRKGWGERIFPALRAFKPELILVSAGFDGHVRDPLAHLRLTEDDFDWVTREIVKIADEFCRGRVVSSLEGGYDLHALAASVAVHVRALMEG